MLLSRLLDLNETQSGILAIVFKVAQKKDWPLIDLKDPAKPFKGKSMNTVQTIQPNMAISPNSLSGAIQRSLLVLEEEGADQFSESPHLI